jgi:hypothetical protein
MAEENDTRPVITEFDYHELYAEHTGLNLKRFSEISEEWVDFVMINREECRTTGTCLRYSGRLHCQ